MKIAVINEVSASKRNRDILDALKGVNCEVLNLGMNDPMQQPQLTYLHTGLMAALALELGITDFVVGGCGTGQGFLNSALQYPRVVCGLIQEPLDAWLFARINAGNCVSLALNKGYGWAADLNLRLIFRELFPAEKEGGYPPERVRSQSGSREKLRSISIAAHRPMPEILNALDPGFVRETVSFSPFYSALTDASPSTLRNRLLAF